MAIVAIPSTHILTQSVVLLPMCSRKGFKGAGGPCPGATGSSHRRSRKAKIPIISVILRRRRGLGAECKASARVRSRLDVLLSEVGGFWEDRSLLW